MQKVSVNDSPINLKLISYTLVGCWMMFAIPFLLGKQMGLFLNPIPILFKGLAGIVLYGYVGGIPVGDIETIFVYWTVIGFLLAWCLHKSQRKPGVVVTIIGVGAVLHVLLSALALFPAMILAGR